MQSAGFASFLNQKQLARRWAMSHRTLERWRCHGRGPTYIKLEGKILYRLDDIERYERTRRIAPCATIAEAAA